MEVSDRFVHFTIDICSVEMIIRFLFLFRSCFASRQIPSLKHQAKLLLRDDKELSYD